MKKIVSKAYCELFFSVRIFFSCHAWASSVRPAASCRTKKVTYFQTRIFRRIAYNLINCANNCASELQCQTMTLFPTEKLAFRRSLRPPVISLGSGTVSPYAVVLSAGNTRISSGERKLRFDIRRCINVDEQKASVSKRDRSEKREEDKTKRRKMANVNVLGRKMFGPVIQNYR